MKVEAEYLKHLLSKAQSLDKGYFTLRDLVESESESESEKFVFHMLLLADKRIVINDHNRSSDIGISRLGNGEPMIGIVYLRLTPEGHEFIEALNNDTVWKKIKKELKSPSISTLVSSSKFLLEQAVKQTLDSGS